MEPRESFVFYRSFYESMEELSVEQRERLFSAITEYAIYGNELEVSGVVKALFTVIKPSLDANRKKYEDGKKGGRPKVEKSTSGNNKTPKSEQEKPKTKNKKTSGFENKETSGYCKQESTVAVTVTDAVAVADTVSETGNESVSVSETDTPFPGAETSHTHARIIPTIDDVIEYAESRGRVDLAESFFDYYDAADWHDRTGVVVRNWKQKFISWELSTPKSKQQQKQESEKRKYDYGDDEEGWGSWD